MKPNYFKQLGILAAMVTLAGVILGCDENENRRGRFSYYPPTTPNYANNEVYNAQGGRPTGIGVLPFGGAAATGGGGIYDGRTGQMDPRYGRNGSAYPGTLGGVNKGNAQRATRTYPYVIDQQDVKWAAECSGKEDQDDDQDGICNDYEFLNHASTAVHPMTYNGFKVYGVYGRYESKNSTSNRIDTIKNDASSLTSIPDNVGIIPGGWSKGSEPTNWNTSIKEEYSIGRTTLPFVHEVALEGTDSSNALLKKGNKFSVGYFAGFSSEDNGRGVIVNDNGRDDLVVTVCTAGWFRKPVNSQGSAFRIMNAARWADDEVRILDNGKLVAYSIRDNSTGSGFSKFFQEKSKVFGGEGNQLDYRITDSSFHYMEFCYTNVKQRDGQGEVRYIRDVGKSDMGYEPLSAADFRVVAPEYVDKDGATKVYAEIDNVHSVEGWRAKAKDDDVIAKAKEMEQARSQGNGGGSGPCPGGQPADQSECSDNGKIVIDKTKLNNLQNDRNAAQKREDDARADKERIDGQIRDEAKRLYDQLGPLIDDASRDLDKLKDEQHSLELIYMGGKIEQEPAVGPIVEDHIQTNDLRFWFEFNGSDNSKEKNYGLSDIQAWIDTQVKLMATFIASGKAIHMKFIPIADGAKTENANKAVQNGRIDLINGLVRDELKTKDNFKNIKELKEVTTLTIDDTDYSHMMRSGTVPKIRFILVQIDVE